MTGPRTQKQKGVVMLAVLGLIALILWLHKSAPSFNSLPGLTAPNIGAPQYSAGSDIPSDYPVPDNVYPLRPIGAGTAGSGCCSWCGSVA